MARTIAPLLVLVLCGCDPVDPPDDPNASSTTTSNGTDSPPATSSGGSTTDGSGSPDSSTSAGPGASSEGDVGTTASAETTGLGSSTSSEGGSTTASDAPDCGDADVELIAETWMACGASNLVGQTASAPGVTCNDVCCVFGFEGCAYRTAQQNFDACIPPNPVMSGLCEDVFMPSWNSGCLCM